MSDIPDNAPAPRLCIIVKWPDFEGYGFNLHAEKSKPGQYIGKVDPDSPAELAGLLEGDRIVEVNGVNIANENHKQVVQRIKSIATETRLLVLDPKADKYYKSKNIVVRGTQENVIVKTSARDRKINTTTTTQHVDDEDDDNAPPLPSTPQPVFGTVTNGHHHHHHDDADNRSVSSAASSSAASEASTQPQPVGAAPENDRDSTSDTAVMNTAERARDRSPSPLPEEGDDNSSQEGDTKSTEEHIPPPEEHLKNAYEKPLEEELVKPPSEDSSSEEEDETPPASENAHEEGNVAETSKAVEAEAACEAAPSSHDPDSDLEAEYDSVVLVRDGKGGAESAAPPLSTSRHSSSASSSAGSHSSRGTDPAHTDPATQSPMSTSPTPPPSLEPTPAPAPVSAQTPAPNTTPVPTTTTPVPATTTTTKPAPQPVAKNNYNTGGLNLNMSAAEMRAKLARKKKADPRNDSLDLRKKYEIIQNM